MHTCSWCPGKKTSYMYQVTSDIKASQNLEECGCFGEAKITYHLDLSIINGHCS